MSVTDKDIDKGLQRLAQLAPDDSVWGEIERELSPQRSIVGRLLRTLRSAPRIAVGAGLAATLVLGMTLTFYMQSGLQYNRSDQAGGASESTVQIIVAQQDAEQLSTAPGADSVESSDTKDSDKTVRGKYARHLYAGDEALWDAMLEEEIHLVDIAILRSSPANQQKLWLYRKTLMRELAALRYQSESGKYLF